MSLFAVQNGEGKWLGCEIYCDEPDWFDHGGFMWKIRSVAEENMKLYGGHVVELVEKHTPVVVSEEEAKMLKRAKVAAFPAHIFDSGAPGSLPGSQDRLMRAYVIGWTVEKPKLWNVKVPHSTDGYYWRGISGQVHTYTEPDQHAHVLKTDAYVWTQKQIDDAELQDCEKVDVTDDEL